MNARILEAAGSAVVITERQLEEEKLTRTIIELLADTNRLQAMGETAGALARPEAAKDIADQLLGLAA